MHSSKVLGGLSIVTPFAGAAGLWLLLEGVGLVTASVTHDNAVAAPAWLAWLSREIFLVDVGLALLVSVGGVALGAAALRRASESTGGTRVLGAVGLALNGLALVATSVAVVVLWLWIGG